MYLNEENLNRKLGTRVDGFARFIGQYAALKIIFNTIFNLIFRIIGIILLFKILAMWMAK